MSRRKDRYIVVRNWDLFQHPDVKRTQSTAWVKLYTRLLHDDDFMELTEHRRYIFLMLLTHYALSHEEVTTSTARLSHVLATRVVTADIKALVQAGFITLSASKPASKPAGKLLDRTEQKRRDLRSSPSLLPNLEPLDDENGNHGWDRLGVSDERFFAQTTLFKRITDADEGTWDLVGKLSARLPVSVLHSLNESLETRNDIESPAGFVVGALKAELEKRRTEAA